jgi:cephalosporin-C deacetylase-like acetyl esterase
VSDALSQLGEGEKTPEKKVRVVFAQFWNERMPQLRQENPDLKLSQVKELCWKEWQKAPENPFANR